MSLHQKQKMKDGRFNWLNYNSVEISFIQVSVFLEKIIDHRKYKLECNSSVSQFNVSSKELVGTYR